MKPDSCSVSIHSPLSVSAISIPVKNRKSGFSWNVSVRWQHGKCLLLVLFALMNLEMLHGQGTLTNGGNHNGTISTNDVEDTWTFNAGTGDSVDLRLTATNFYGKLFLYGPDGAVLAYDQYEFDTEIRYRTTNSGAFTVVISSYLANGAGTYQLHFLKVPGPFVIADDGGALTNGGNHNGVIERGDIDPWAFTADVGETVDLRLNATNFYGRLYLYDDAGKLVAYDQYEYDTEIRYRTTNSGTFTVVIASYLQNGAGTYQLHFLKIPGPFVIADDGGALTNGGNHNGAIERSDLDPWTFTANAGETVDLRLNATNFYGRLYLYDDAGKLVAYDQYEYDTEIRYRTTNSGTFTVVIASYLQNGAGTYQLHFLKIPGPFVISEDGGALTNGGNHNGVIERADLDPWTFAANADETVDLRLNTTNFYGRLYLYDDAGKLVAYDQYEYDTEIRYRTTNSGTFTVVIASYLQNGAGTYQLHFLKIPGPFVISEDGGALTNGGNRNGVIERADLDPWTFAANVDETVDLRLNTTNFYGRLYLYDDVGRLLAYDQYDYDTEVIYRTTNSGTFTVVISSYVANGAGTYQLHFLKTPGEIVIPPGDDGGSLGSGISAVGQIDRADIDPWRFTACRGDLISLRLLSTNFYGRLYLYGPDGALLKYAQYDYDLAFAYVATNCGTFTVVVSSYLVNGTGTYKLLNNDLSDALKLCPPERAGENWNLSGVGAKTNDTFVIYTTTNMALSFAQWTSLRTNQFGQFGIFNLTNVATGLEAQRYFRLVMRSNADR